jgi:5'-nucleotidase
MTSGSGGLTRAGGPYYWIGSDAPTGLPEDGADFGAIAVDCVSMIPLGLELTAYEMIEEMREWKSK